MTFIPARAISIALLTMTLAAPVAQSPPVTAFTGLRLIDGTDRPAVDNAVLLVRDGRIVSAGANVSIPAAEGSLAPHVATAR